MVCLRIPNVNKRLPGGFVCGFHPVYEFGGYLFEVHSYHGPTPLRRKDHEPRMNVPKGFWGMWAVFEKFSDGAKRACLYKEVDNED
ncbi:MAG: hypothetical protein U9Q07_02790 [Planctomycetota bacterium]|nr:hypothetical protein [Planctomycetota bacterium]